MAGILVGILACRLAARLGGRLAARWAIVLLLLLTGNYSWGIWTRLDLLNI